MIRATQIRTLLYVLLSVGIVGVYIVLLDQVDRYSWVKPTLMASTLTIVAIGIFLSVRDGLPGNRTGVVSSPRRLMVSAIVVTVCGLVTIHSSGTLLMRAPEFSLWIRLIGGLFTFTYGLVQLTQVWQRRGSS